MKRTILFFLATARGFRRRYLRSSVLRGYVTAYLNALVAHDPAALPVAANVKFTEDNVQKKLGEGLWQTASKLRAFRQDVLDDRHSTAASLVVLEEVRGPDPVLVPWEIFKVYGGQIHAVEAFMKVFPASMGTGWE